MSKQKKIDALIEKAKKSIAEKGYGYFACQEKSSGNLIGFLGLNYIELQGMPTGYTVSWVLAKEYWGNGYATEGARALLQLGFEKFNLEKIGACCVATNDKSIRIMKRLGMHYESSFNFPGIEKNHPHCNHVYYSISKKEYETFK